MKISDVARKNHKYESCQLEIDIDEDLRFIVDLPEINSLTKKDMSNTIFAASPSGRVFKPENHPNSFGKTSHNCSKKNFKDKLNKHFRYVDKIYLGKMSKEDLIKQISNKIECIGCRKATESMYDILIDKGKKRGNDNCAKEIFTKINIDTSQRQLVLDPTIIEDDNKFYQYVHILSQRAQDLANTLKMKKNRCSLHSLENRACFETRSKLNRGGKIPGGFSCDFSGENCYNSGESYFWGCQKCHS